MPPLKPNDPTSGSSMSSTSSTSGHTVTNSTLAASENSFNVRAKQASSAWHTLEDAWKNVSEHSSMFSHIAETMEQHDTTQGLIQEKGKRICELESAMQTQFDQLQIRYTQWSQEKSRLEHWAVDLEKDTFAKAQETLKTEKATYTKEVKDLTKQLEIEKKNVVTLKEELKKARIRTHRVEEDLSLCTKELSKWEKYLLVLKDIDHNKVDADVNKIFKRCVTIARTHFLRELPTEQFTNSRWDNLPIFLDIRDLDFPPSNSEAAKHVRMAACMHILARRLCDIFFKPCYIPESHMLGDAIQLILAQQFLTGVDRERITRALLLSMYEPKQVDKAINQTVIDTSKEVMELLSPIGGNEAFRKDVQVLFREAAGVWKEVQHSRKAVEVSMTDDFNENRNWPYLEEFDAVEIKGDPGLPKFDMVNLFPCIYVPEDEHIVNPGCVLGPDQNTAVAAEQELRELMAAKRFKGGSIRRDRRPSTRSDGREGPVGSSPTSLKTEDKAAFSGLQRGSKQGN